MIRISQSEDKKLSRIATASDDYHHHGLERPEDPASHDQNVPNHPFPPPDFVVSYDPNDGVDGGSQLVTEDGSQQASVSDVDQDHVDSGATTTTSRGVHAARSLLEVSTATMMLKVSGHGGAIKRACDDGEAETEEDDLVALTCSSSSLDYAERRSPPKKPKFVVTYREMREFFALLNEESIQQFLKRDACCLISDKYALAMVFTYFKRAKFYLNEYTRTNFYLALYLASDIEEDVDDYKYEIFPWALGRRWRSKFTGFLRKRDALLRRIGYRAIVSRKCCEEVMSLVPDHSAWKRERSEDHGGATRAYLINRGKRYLSIKANMGYEELNFPRGPYEKPRPCLLCMLNRGGGDCQSYTISAFNPTLCAGIIDGDCCGDAAAAQQHDCCCNPACHGACPPLSVSSLDDAALNTSSSGIDTSTYLVSADLTSVSCEQSEDALKNHGEPRRLNRHDDESSDEGIQSSSSDNKCNNIDAKTSSKEAVATADKYVEYLSQESLGGAKKVVAQAKPAKSIAKVSSHQDCAIVSTVSCAKSASANHLHPHNESRMMPKISNHSLNRLKMDDAAAASQLPSSNKFCDRKQSAASDLENTSFGAVSVFDSFFDESCYYEATTKAFDQNAATHTAKTTWDSNHLNALPPVAQRSSGTTTLKAPAATLIATTITTRTIHAPLNNGYKYPSTTSVGHLLVQDLMTSDEDIIDDDDDYYSRRSRGLLNAAAGASYHHQPADGDYESDDVFAAASNNDASRSKNLVTLSDSRPRTVEMSKLKASGDHGVVKKATTADTMHHHHHRRRQNYSYSSTSIFTSEQLAAAKAISIETTINNSGRNHPMMTRSKLATTASALDQQVPAPTAAKC